MSNSTNLDLLMEALPSELKLTPDQTSLLLTVAACELPIVIAAASLLAACTKGQQPLTYCPNAALCVGTLHSFCRSCPYCLEEPLCSESHRAMAGGKTCGK